MSGLAIGDIFGGTASLPVLFLPAPLIAGTAVLAAAGRSDVYLTSLGAILTIVCMAGLSFRPRRQFARMGVDSIVVLGIYALGIAGLFTLA